MKTQTKIFIAYCEADKAKALKLIEHFSNMEMRLRPTNEMIEPGRLNYSGYALLVLLSNRAFNDSHVRSWIDFAQENNIKIYPVLVEECQPPASLINLRPFDYHQLLESYTAQSLNLDTFSTARPSLSGIKPNRDNPAFSGAQPAPKKNSIKSIIEAINPFKKKFNKTFGDDFEDPFVSLKRGYKSSKPPAMAAPTQFARPEATSGAEPPESPMLATSAPIAEPKQADPAKGKVLYDIPDSMTVHVQQRCVVRVGKNEAVVLDDDTFSPAVKIENIPISKVMEADLIDTSDEPRFNIKRISSVEMIVEDDAYTEWIFMVTPLVSGKFPLSLKISVIKVIEGKERRKELVFERSVNISAAASNSTTPPGIIPLVSQTATPAQPTADNTPALKDLANEQNVKEYDPPAVFISYAHLDKTYFDIFIQYLQTHSGWKIWTDRNIEIGSDWYQSIQKSITDSDIAVLLISANFISSGFIKEHEYNMFAKLEALKSGFKFLPVFLRDVDFTRWEELAAMQLFVAYGDEYGVPEKKGQMIPFAKLCRFDNNGQLIPNDNIDTYFKNMVKKAEKDWLIGRS